MTKGTIFFICSTSAIQLPQHDGGKDAGAKRRRKKCGKIEIYSDELSSHIPTSPSSAKSPIASKSPGIFIVQGKPESRMRGNSESDDKATVKLVDTKEESGDVDLSESENASEEDVTGKRVVFETVAEKPYAPSQSVCQGRSKAEWIEW